MNGRLTFTWRWITSAAVLLVLVSSRPGVSFGPEPPPSPPAPLISETDRIVHDACSGITADDRAYAVTPEFCSMSLHTVQLVNAAGDPVSMRVLVARDYRQRSAGYQYVGPAIIAETAILFVLSSDVWGGFHMCNVESPLDIAWFRSDGTLLDLQRMEPGRRGFVNCSPVYAPRTADPYRFALETAAGRLEALGLAPGGSLVIDSVP